MKTTIFSRTLRSSTLAAALAMALASAGIANATLIQQTFATPDGNEGGIVTFSDYLEPGSGLAANQLKITFDNTTNGPDYATAITGLVFNVNQHIDGIASFTFVDGNNITPMCMPGPAPCWEVSIDIGSSISNNTVFDITFASGDIKGGIYNAADPGGQPGDLDNVFPDVATLILTISSPSPWNLLSIGSSTADDADPNNDASILRMQRAGTDGEDSLKLVTSTSSSTTSGTASNGTPTPEPGMLSLLGVGLLGQGLLMYQRRRRQQK